MRIYFLSTILITFGANCLVAQDRSDFPDIPSQIQIEALEGSLGAVEPDFVVKPISRRTFELIRHFEGWRPEHYDDPSGYCTIGYGHLIAHRKCSEVDLGEFENPITLERGQQILLADTRIARIAVQQVTTVDLSNAEFGALVSFTFNLGKGNLKKSTLLRLLNSGQPDAAAYEFRKWVYSKGKRYTGLERRRSCETALFLNVLRLNDDKTLQTDSCKNLGIAEDDFIGIDISQGE